MPNPLSHFVVRRYSSVKGVLSVGTRTRGQMNLHATTDCFESSPGPQAPDPDVRNQRLPPILLLVETISSKGSDLMTKKARETTAKTFELAALLNDLIQRASARLKWKGCYKSGDCGTKLVDDYVLVRRLRKT